jgi:hypothetical protein
MEETYVTIRFSFGAIALLALTSCKDKGEDTTTGDGGTGGDTAVTGDGGTTDGGTTDGGTTDGGTTDGGTTDGGTTDGGSGDGGSGDGGSGDGGGGSDTGEETYVFPDKWGTLMDGPACKYGSWGSIRSADDKLAIAVDLTELMKEACADKKSLRATATKPAEAFTMLRGTKLSNAVCALEEGAKDESEIIETYRLSVGTVAIEVTGDPNWCDDPASSKVMGQVITTWSDVLVTSGGTTQEMGPHEDGPNFLAAL